jgi:hypothetical protein
MYQQLWGYKVEDKLYLGVREQKRLNTTALQYRLFTRRFITLSRESAFLKNHRREVAVPANLGQLTNTYHGIPFKLPQLYRATLRYKACDPKTVSYLKENYIFCSEGSPQEISLSSVLEFESPCIIMPRSLTALLVSW